MSCYTCNYIPLIRNPLPFPFQRIIVSKRERERERERESLSDPIGLSSPPKAFIFIICFLRREKIKCGFREREIICRGFSRD